MKTPHRFLSGGIQQRLFLILAVASALVTIASLLAILAMSQIRSEFESVSAHELPGTTAALRLAQIGERLQGRAPALIAAEDDDLRASMIGLIAVDLDALADEVQQLKAAESRDMDLIDGISANAQALRENLTAIGALQATRSALAQRLKQGLVRTLELQDRIRQILGPSILAITDAVTRGIARNEQEAAATRTAEAPGSSSNATFIAAVAAQAPLREAERLADAALNNLLIAIEAHDERDLDATRDRFRRTLGEWQSLIPTMPAGLRPPLDRVTAALSVQSDGPDSIFANRDETLRTLRQADGLVTENRELADRLSVQVDRLVASASAAVTTAERSIDATIVRRTLLLAGLSVAAIVTAVLISYRFVIRDLGAGMRSITIAMMRLAGGEHDVTVPATGRRDEIGDLARAFTVFRANARRMVTLDQQLVEKSNLLVATFNNMNDGFSVYDADARLVAWNAQFVRLYNLPEDSLTPGTPLDEIQRVVIGRGAVFRTSLGQRLDPKNVSAKRFVKAQTFEVDLGNGRTVEMRSNPIPTGGFVTIHIDVSERKAIEAQLRQAQKMEVVGQLTGGLAHDFNNLLAVIQGNLHLLEDRLENQPDLRERASRAIAAGDRAAMQIERLLAFGRRQKLRPSVVDLSDLIASMSDLLEYSVGAEVTVQIRLVDALPPVRVDPGQLENALLNLALNARDAMDGHGTLIIGARPVSCAELTPGAFVELSVRDSGRGMPPDVIEHAIEPFFTTKAPGKGSGLGLSMVYGFVRQSGGTLRIDSAPGAGTAIIFTLPVADAVAVDGAQPGDVPAGVDSVPERPPTGETILVVEDDAALREAVVAQLLDFGYRVAEAESSKAALDQLRADPSIRLLYTDIRLGGGADGFTLARAARGLRPSIGVIYTSAEQPAALSSISDAPVGGEFLQKPVPPDVLAAAFARAFRPANDVQTSSTSVSKT